MRVDGWLGVHYFGAMYGRASDVFGAMPSLHCAYPLIVLLYGWGVSSKVGRAASIAFFLLMCFSAVYLDHHWVFDVVAGIVYCVVVFFAVRALTYCADSVLPPRSRWLKETADSPEMPAK